MWRIVINVSQKKKKKAENQTTVCATFQKSVSESAEEEERMRVQ